MYITINLIINMCDKLKHCAILGILVYDFLAFLTNYKQNESRTDIVKAITRSKK